VLRDPEAARAARMLALHGMSRDAWKRYTAVGGWRYEIVANGYKYNLGDLASSLGIHQLRRLDGFHARRRAIALRYQAAFAGLDGVETPPDGPDGGHAWHLYLLRVRPERLRIDRDGLVAALRERRIGTSVHFIPLHLHPYYADTFGYRAGDFPAAEGAFERTVSLPLYPAMSDGDVDRVVDAVTEVVRRERR